MYSFPPEVGAVAGRHMFGLPLEVSAVAGCHMYSLPPKVSALCEAAATLKVSMGSTGPSNSKARGWQAFPQHTARASSPAAWWAATSAWLSSNWIVRAAAAASASCCLPSAAQSRACNPITKLSACTTSTLHACAWCPSQQAAKCPQGAKLLNNIQDPDGHPLSAAPMDCCATFASDLDEPVRPTPPRAIAASIQCRAWIGSSRHRGGLAPGNLAAAVWASATGFSVSPSKLRDTSIPLLCLGCSCVSMYTLVPQVLSETDLACSLVCAAAVSACNFSCFRRHSAPMTAAVVWVCCNLAWTLSRWARASCAWASAAACCALAVSLCCSSCAAEAARSAVSFPCSCSATTYRSRWLSSASLHGGAAWNMRPALAGTIACAGVQIMVDCFSHKSRHFLQPDAQVLGVKRKCYQH